MLTRHAIQVLRGTGHTQKEISELTGVSEREGRRIEDEPTTRTVEVLRRLRADGYDGGKSAVYELVRSPGARTEWSPSGIRPSLR